MKLTRIKRLVADSSQQSVEIYTHPDLYIRDPQHANEVTDEELACALLQAQPTLDNKAIILRAVKVRDGAYHLLVQGRLGNPKKWSTVVEVTSDTKMSYQSVDVTWDEIVDAGFPDLILKPDFISYYATTVNMPKPLKNPKPSPVVPPTEKGGIAEVMRPQLDADEYCALDEKLQQSHEDLMTAVDDVLKGYEQQFATSGLRGLIQLSYQVNALASHTPEMHKKYDELNGRIDSLLQSVEYVKSAQDGAFSQTRERLIPSFMEQATCLGEKDRQLKLYKRELIWLLYAAAQQEAQSIFRMPVDTTSATKNKQNQIDAFNSVFSGIAVINQDQLSGIENAYQELVDLSLDDLLSRANRVLPTVKSLTERFVPTMVLNTATSVLGMAPIESDVVRGIKKTARKKIESIIDMEMLAGRPLFVELPRDGVFAWSQQVVDLVSERVKFIEQQCQLTVVEVQKAEKACQEVGSAFKEIRQLVRSAHLIRMEMELTLIKSLCNNMSELKSKLRDLERDYHVFTPHQLGHSAKKQAKLAELDQARKKLVVNQDECGQLLDDAQAVNAPLPLDFPYADESELLEKITTKAAKLCAIRVALENDQQFLQQGIAWVEAELIKKRKEVLNKFCDANRNLYVEVENINSSIEQYLQLPQDLLEPYLPQWRETLKLLNQGAASLSSVVARTNREDRFVKSKRDQVNKASSVAELAVIERELADDAQLLTTAKLQLVATQTALQQAYARQRALENAPILVKLGAWVRYHSATIKGFLAGFFAGGAAGAAAGAIGGSAVLPGLGTLAGALIGFAAGAFCGAIGGSGIGRFIDARQDKHLIAQNRERALSAPVAQLGGSDAAIQRAMQQHSALSPVIKQQPSMPDTQSDEPRQDDAVSVQPPAPLGWGEWMASFFRSAPTPPAGVDSPAPVAGLGPKVF